jgi:hypothetical protein
VSLFPRLIIIGAECYIFYAKVPNLPFAQSSSACNHARFHREILVRTLLLSLLSPKGMPSEPDATTWSLDACNRGKPAVERTTDRSGSLYGVDRNPITASPVRLHRRHRAWPARGPAWDTGRKRILPKQRGDVRYEKQSRVECTGSDDPLRRMIPSALGADEGVQGRRRPIPNRLRKVSAAREQILDTGGVSVTESAPLQTAS